MKQANKKPKQTPTTNQPTKTSVAKETILQKRGWCGCQLPNSICSLGSSVPVGLHCLWVQTLLLQTCCFGKLHTLPVLIPQNKLFEWQKLSGDSWRFRWVWCHSVVLCVSVGHASNLSQVFLLILICIHTLELLKVLNN